MSLAADFNERVQHRPVSKVERLITFSTSAVAVCCCRYLMQFEEEQAHILDRNHRLVSESGDYVYSAFGL